VTTIYAAILILGATATAERRMETGASIEEIIGRVAWGAVSDVIGGEQTERFDLGGLVRQEVLRTAELTIDGHPRTGWAAWAGAAWRVCGYALDKQNAGSVEYSYHINIRGFAVKRHTEIRDGRVTLTTSTGWVERVPITKGIVRRIPIHVSITIRADETDLQSTRIVGTATGTADTRSFRCGLVRSIADSAASRELDAGLRQALETVQRRGVQWYLGATELGDVIEILQDGIELGRRLRR
jgi:hypothetical protein